MNNKEIMLECMKLGATLTSPSIHDRHKVVAEIGEFLYSKIVALGENPNADTHEPRPRGRPPKPRAEHSNDSAPLSEDTPRNEAALKGIKL